MKQKKFRRLAAVLAALALCLGLTACGNPAEEARAGFDEAMKALKSGDAAQISNYFDKAKVDEFLKSNEELEGLSDAVLDALSHLEYTVNSTEEENKRVKLEADITMIDYSAVMKQYVQSVMELVASPEYQAKIGTMDEVEYKSMLTAKMAELLRQENPPTVSETKTVYLKKDGGKWRIDDADGELTGSLFVNLSQAVSALIQ